MIQVARSDSCISIIAATIGCSEGSAKEDKVAARSAGATGDEFAGIGMAIGAVGGTGTGVPVARIGKAPGGSGLDGNPFGGNLAGGAGGGRCGMVMIVSPAGRSGRA